MDNSNIKPGDFVLGPNGYFIIKGCHLSHCLYFSTIKVYINTTTNKIETLTPGGLVHRDAIKSVWDLSMYEKDDRLAIMEAIIRLNGSH